MCSLLEVANFIDPRILKPNRIQHGECPLREFSSNDLFATQCPRDKGTLTSRAVLGIDDHESTALRSVAVDNRDSFSVVRRRAIAPSPDNQIEVRPMIGLPNGPSDEVRSDYILTLFDVTPDGNRRVAAAIAGSYVVPTVFSYCVLRRVHNRIAATKSPTYLT